jgi:hypothetical protein
LSPTLPNVPPKKARPDFQIRRRRTHLFGAHHCMHRLQCRPVNHPALRLRIFELNPEPGVLGL